MRHVLNKWDERKIKRSIIALENSPCENTELAKWIYAVSFIAPFGLEGTPRDVLDLIFNYRTNEIVADENAPHTEETAKASVNAIEMLVPCLYKSNRVSDEAKALIKGNPRELLANDFAVGDLLYTDKTSYIFDGDSLVELRRDGVIKTGVEETLENLKNEERYALLRPAQAIKITHSTEWSDEGFTEKQKALVSTAEQFFWRGMRAQYDDTSFTDGGEYRWQIRVNKPEDYTLQSVGYSNCAAFAVDVQRMAIGYKSDYFSTKQLAEAEEIRAFYYEPTFNESDEEKARVEEEFMSTVEPGDIIVIRRANGTGHAMVYIGCGDVIHSGGGNYNYAEGKETYEPTFRQMRARDLFTKEVYPRSYIFEKIKQLVIVRPAMLEDTAPTKEALSYLGDMGGIVAEKLSSHVEGNTVNLGEEITFTLSIFNTNSDERTLPVEFTVRENTTLVSGELSKSVTVAPLEKVKLIYKVRVNDDKALLNKAWVSGKGSFVGGVEVKCPDVKICRTLNAEERTKFLKALDTFTPGTSAVDGVNFVYGKAFGVSLLDDGVSGLFGVNEFGKYVLENSTRYFEILVHPLYGGRSFSTPQYENKRVRLVRPEALVIGDLIMLDGASGEKIFAFAGEYIIDPSNGERIEKVKEFLESLLSSEKYFGIVRPSIKF